MQVSIIKTGPRGMTRIRVHIDSFAALDALPPDSRLTYEIVKAASLRAGKFSSFEASATPKRARFFTQLCRDPEVVITDLGFPWTGINRTNARDTFD